MSAIVLFAYHGACLYGSRFGPLSETARARGISFVFITLYEKISSRLPGQFCYIDVVLTVVKNSLAAVSLNFHPGNWASPLVSVYMEKFPSR
jgi:hypothetical protein